MDNKPVEGQQLDIENAIKEYLETGSRVSREKIIALGQTIAGIFADLYSSGSADSVMKGAAATGFLKALKNYEPQGKIQFSTYAAQCIISEIRKELKKRELFKVPEWLIQLQDGVNKATEELARENHLIPTLQEIADKVNNAESGTEEEMMEGTKIPVKIYNKSLKALCYEPFKLPVEDVIMIRKALDRMSDIQQKVLALFSANIRELCLAMEEEEKALVKMQEEYLSLLEEGNKKRVDLLAKRFRHSFPRYFEANQVKRYFEGLAEEFGLLLADIKHLKTKKEADYSDNLEKESGEIYKPGSIALYLEGRYRGLLQMLDYMRYEETNLQVEKVRTTRNETIPARVSIYLLVDAIFKELPVKEQLISEPDSND